MKGFTKVAFLIFSLLLTIATFGQHTFIGRVESYNMKSLNICTQFGEDSRLLKTITTDANGEFSYNFENKEFGLYRIFLENNDYFDIIYNNENIEIITKLQNPEYNMIVVKSDENKQFYDYLISNYEYEYKIEILKQFLAMYPDGKFYKAAEDELSIEVSNKNKNLENVIKKNPSSFTARYISYFKEIVAPAKYDEYEKLNYIKSNYLNNYSFKDEGMINSDAYTYITINYLKLNRANNAKQYYEYAENILNYASNENHEVSKFILEYILSGFEIMELNEEAVKLSLEFGDLCSDSDEDDNLKVRIRNNTELAIGSKVKDFYHETILGEKYRLSEMKSEYTLIIFWATWCNHCADMLPKLAKDSYIFNSASIDVIMISVDENRDNLNEFLAINQLPWKVICDYKGFNSPIVEDYAVYATPLMFLVDKELNIVSKPFNEDRLLSEIDKIINK